MIVFKENERIYFAIPMCLSSSLPINKDPDCEENSPAWHIDDGKGTIAATTLGHTRASDILRYSDIFNLKDINYESIRGASMKIPKELTTNCIIPEGQLGISVCIARDDVAYEISKFGTIKKLGDVEMYNINRGVSMMIWENTVSIKDIEKRLKCFYEILGKEKNRLYFPIMLMNTKEKGHKLIS